MSNLASKDNTVKW